MQGVQLQAIDAGDTRIITGQEIKGDKIVDIVATARLIGQKIHLLRCKREYDYIVLPDKVEDTTGWYEILAVSEDCIHFNAEHIGKLVWLPLIGIGESYMVGPGERIVRESWFSKRDGPPLMIVDPEKSI